MGIIIRQSSWSTLLSIAGIILGYLNVLYFFPQYLTPGQIGLTRVIQDFAMLMVPFAQLGTSHAIIRFFPTFVKDARKREGFFTLMLFMATMGFVAFLLLLYLIKSPVIAIFSLKAPEVTTYLWLVFVLVYILVLFNIITDFTRSHLNIIVPNFLKEILLRLLTTVSIALYVFGMVDFNEFLYCIVGIYFINLLLLSVYLTYKGVIRINLSFINTFTFSDIKPIVQYGMFALLGAGGTIIISKVDSIMVTSLLGTHFNGIYTTAFYMAVVIDVPRRMITQISTPLIARSLENNRMNEIADIYSKSALNQLIVGLLLFIGLYVNLDNIYQLIPNSEIYVLGKWVVIFIGIGKLFDMGAGLNGEIIILSKYYKVNIILATTLALFTISANLLFIPMYGITGAALGTALSLIIFNVIKFLFVYYKFKLQPFTYNNLKVLVIGAATLLIGCYIPEIDNIMADIVMRSAVILLVYSGAIVLTRSSAEVTHILQSILRFIRKKQ